MVYGQTLSLAVSRDLIFLNIVTAHNYADRDKMELQLSVVLITNKRRASPCMQFCSKQLSGEQKAILLPC